jgi:membrane-associated protein
MTMELLAQFVDIFLHVDDHLLKLVADYGAWVYAILFVIIFCETGLVVTPFLPGDSLLFAAGALAAGASTQGGDGLNLVFLIPLLIVAAIIGDAVNFAIGTAVGPGFLEKEKIRFIKKEHLQKTQRFYEKYGGKTIILARFVPIVRTFAPFVAGIGRMSYARFATFNVVGAIAWVCICTLAGFFFGELPFVKKNFELVILGIIGISVLPIAIEMLKGFLEARKAKASAAP